MKGANLYYVGMCLLLGVANFSLTKSQGRSRILSSKAGKGISQDTSRDDLNDVPKPKSKSAKSNRKRTEVSIDVFIDHYYLLITHNAESQQSPPPLLRASFS